MENLKRGGPRVSAGARLGILAVFALALLVPGSAAASHIKGGTVWAEINGDQISGDAAYYEDLGGSPCTVGDTGNTYEPNLTIAGPSGTSGSITTELLPAVCPDNGNIGIWRGTFTADLNTVLGTAPPDGEYVLTLSDCCYIGGILNGSDIEDLNVQARVEKAASGARYSPRFGNNPRLGIPIGGTFFDSLAPSVPGSTGPFTVQSLVGTDYGPDTDVVTPGSNATLSIPPETTGGMAEGDPYLYSVRVTHDATGNYSDRSVVLIAGLDDGLPPPPDPEPEPEPPVASKAEVEATATPLPKKRGIEIQVRCDEDCTAAIGGHRALRQKTKEPDWGFLPVEAELAADQLTSVKLLFSKGLRKTVKRGLGKGINPIKFQLKTTVGDESSTYVVATKF